MYSRKPANDQIIRELLLSSMVSSKSFIRIDNKKKSEYFLVLRSREGGLRLGEMERDAIIAHGLAKFLKEKLLDNSDAYVCFVCDRCGLFAQRFDRQENKAYPSNDDTYHCPACKNYNEISKVRIPYAFKLLLQELMALNIAPRIRCKKDIYG